MRRLYQVVLAAAMCAAPALGQPDRVVVPLTDPSRPVELKANLVNGSITVRGYAGKEVIVQSASQKRDHHRDDERGGMRRVPMNASGIEVEEENNRVTVSAPPFRGVSLDIQVPARASVRVKTVNGGNILIEGVDGETEAQNINGSVTLNNVSGSVVAHALNGRLTATFARVDPNKAMSFSSLNGTVDVTFPASLKANVKVKTEHGEVWSDFDIATTASSKPTVEAARDGKGKYRVKLDGWVYGTINGGGPQFQFSTLNGSIYIRKAGQ